MTKKLALLPHHQRRVDAHEKMDPKKCETCGEMVRYKLCLQCDEAFEYGHSVDCPKRSHVSHTVA